MLYLVYGSTLLRGFVGVVRTSRLEEAVPETIIPMDQRPVIHEQISWTTQWGLPKWLPFRQS